MCALLFVLFCYVLFCYVLPFFWCFLEKKVSLDSLGRAYDLVIGFHLDFFLNLSHLPGTASVFSLELFCLEFMNSSNI